MAIRSPLGTVVRATSLGLLLWTTGLPPRSSRSWPARSRPVSTADAVRLDSPPIALSASVAGPVAVAALVRSTGLSLPATGVALTVTAVVLAGLGSLLGGRWATPAITSVATAAIGGLLLVAGEPVASANAA